MAETIRYAWGASSLGSFIAACSERGLVAFEFADPGPGPVGALQDDLAAHMVGDAAGMADTVGRLAALVDRPHADPGLALDLRGTGYQGRVWTALRDIPPGRTVSYGDIAAGLGAPREAREVAEACAANRIAILVPCHRVVRKSGAVSGYRWGFRRKRELLLREQKALEFQLA